MKAFIFDPIWDDLITSELLAKLSAIDVTPIVTKEIRPLRECRALYAGTEPRLLAINPDYVGWKVSKDDYRDVPNLRAILGAATSFAWIDTSVATDKDIPVCNIRNFSTEAVAEWAMTICHNLARQAPRLIKDRFPLDYDKDFMKYRGVELRGKTAGIIGLGHIGGAIAARCAGLGMRVVYWSRSKKDVAYTQLELAELFRTADVIFPTITDNADAKTLISDDLIGTMKRSAILVSIVHGLFNESLVLDMVRRGDLFGYGFEAKPSTFGEYSGNVWAAPAYAWVTDGSMRNSMSAWVENMVLAAKGEFPNRVN